MVSELTFKSSTHFVFVFAYGVESGLVFYLFFLHVPVQFYQHRLLKRLCTAYFYFFCHRFIEHISEEIYI